MRILNPKGWPQPRGYSNGVLVEGRQVYVAGQIGCSMEGIFAKGFTGQFRLVLENTMAVLAEANAGPQHLTRMTWYITDLGLYRTAAREVGAIYREVFGRYYPTMTMVEVSGLLDEKALIEIESIAVIPKA